MAVVITDSLCREKYCKQHVDIIYTQTYVFTAEIAESMIFTRQTVSTRLTPASLSTPLQSVIEGNMLMIGDELTFEILSRSF